MSKTRPVDISGLSFGGKEVPVIAGPCSIESREQFLRIAQAVKSRGASALRGGIFKLRTDPRSFQGLGNEAFAMAQSVREETQLPYFSEITDPRQISDLYDVVDAFQVGSRNMYNYELLKELGRLRKPILLKRGFSATLKEWLLAADYVLQGGNDALILCERGIRSFETETRNTFDINAIAYIKTHTHFPVVADPSHGTGRWDLVTPVALAAVTAGADGLLVEVHDDPSTALSDRDQALNLEQFEVLMRKLQPLISLRL